MPFQKLTEKKGEQQGQYFLDIAEELFIARGFSSVSMEEIAKKWA